MRFEWDETKAQNNLEKHGMDFNFAKRVFDPYYTEELCDADYNEVRFAAIGLVGGVELVVIYTMRQEAIRIVSARRAERDEREKYWNGYR